MTAEVPKQDFELDSDDPRVIRLQGLPLIQQSKVVGERKGGLVDCWVPSYLIDHEEVPVKKEWAEELARDMNKQAEENGGTGQLMPIVLGYIEGEDKLKIIDGFHRDAALKINGQENVYCAVLLTDWDGLYDERIFTAKHHSHVKFSRVVQWMHEVWQYSGLDQKMTLKQAILLYTQDSDGKRKLKLDPTDAEAAKAWVARKEEKWEMKAMTIYDALHVAETVDTALVKAVREKKRGDVLEAPSPAILKVFANTIPNNFELQNLVMAAAKTHNLTTPKVKSACTRVKDCTPKEAQNVLNDIDWENLEPEYGRTKTQQMRRKFDVRHRGSKVFDQVEWIINNVDRRWQLTLDKGEPIDAEMEQNVLEAIDKIKSLLTSLGSLAVEFGDGIDIEVQVSESEEVSVEKNKGNGNAKGNGNHEKPPMVLGRIRQDMWGFLSGNIDISRVQPFTRDELIACYKFADVDKSHLPGFDNRFKQIQQANLMTD